jgi:hypothetical protein
VAHFPRHHCVFSLEKYPHLDVKMKRIQLCKTHSLRANPTSFHLDRSIQPQFQSLRKSNTLAICIPETASQCCPARSSYYAAPKKSRRRSWEGCTVVRPKICVFLYRSRRLPSLQSSRIDILSTPAMEGRQLPLQIYDLTA